MNILKVNNLTKTYHTKKEEINALKDIDLSVDKGEFIALVGPSGCGKSTILSILSGIEKEYGGKVEIKGNIGYMLQQDVLFEWRNILENSLIGLEINKTLNKKSKDYVIKLLNTYGLKEFIYSYPKNLSGGMKQRVALIRTLATKPDIILLDEPFSALDYQTRLSVSNDIYNILKKEGKTVIIVTHDIAEAVTMADKVIILSKRPAIVKKIINLEWDKNLSPIEKRKDIKFNEYYDMIWKEIDTYE